MEDISFDFNAFSECAPFGIAESLKKINKNGLRPIFVCVGSDLVVGDCLGPLVGTFLKDKNMRSFIYGTLSAPVTAKEVGYASTYLKQMHPNSIAVSIDAAVGTTNDVGTIKVANRGLKPGLGVNKDLLSIGDISIIGVVAEKSQKNYNLFNLTRFNLVYKMANVISAGIEKYVCNNFLNGYTAISF